MRELLSRLIGVFRRRELERSSEEEMRFHLDQEVEAAMRRGATRQEAERAARLRLGPVSAAMEEVRDQRGWGWLEGMAADLRHAWVALRRRPGYLLVASGALVSAVVVNTLVFTILYGVLLRPLPYPEPARLMRLYEVSRDQPKFPLSMGQFEENVRSAKTLDGQALYTGADMQLLHEDRAEMVTAVAITEQFLPMLGGRPVLGRNFEHSEMVGSSRVVILSYGFWKNRLNGDPGIVGKTLRLDRAPWTVVGVAAPGFQHPGGEYRSPMQGETVDVWRPLPMDISEGCFRLCHYTNAIVRLKPGVSAEAARQELDRILDDLAGRFPDAYAGRRARLEPLAQAVTGGSRETVVVLALAGGLVLLLACINVAGLSIARALARRRELSVRAALGCGRWRMARVIVSENLVLGALSAGIGVALATLLLPVLQAVLPAEFPRVQEIVFRWPSALFAVAAAVGAGVAAGLAAAVRPAGGDPAEALQEDSRVTSGSVRTMRVRGALVSAQVALAWVLCFGAVLLVRSSMELGRREHGFQSAGALTFEVALPSPSYDDQRMRGFYREAVRRMEEIPGVTAAGFSTSIPWTGYDDNTSIEVAGFEPREGESSMARYGAATPALFRALGMKVLEGRAISESDTANAARVMVVNRALAQRFFRRRSPLGQTVKTGNDSWRVIGVVSDVRDRPADESAVPAFWTPLEQVEFRRVQAVVRVKGNAAEVVPAVRSALAAVDRELPMANVRSLETVAREALAERRFMLLWCESFAGLAILLAAIGVYSLLRYSVEQRHREIGIRMALGASRVSVVRLVLGGGLALAGLGGAVGLLLSPAVGRTLETMLYGVTARDPAALAAAAGVVLGATVAACLAPCRSALRTQPMSVLREQ